MTRVRRSFVAMTATWLLLSCGGDLFNGHWLLSETLSIAIRSDGGPSTRSCNLQWNLDVASASPGYQVSWFGCTTAGSSAGGTLSLTASSCVVDAGQPTPITTVDCRDISELSVAPCPYTVSLNSGSKLVISGNTMAFDGGWHGASTCSADFFDVAPPNMSGTRQ